MGDTAPAQVAPKRSLFNKRPAWAAASQSPAGAKADESKETDVFSRSTQSLDDLMRQKERARQQEREAAKRRAEKEERRKSKEERRSVVKEGSEEAPIKRRRISEKDYERYGLVSPEKKAARAAAEDEAEDGIKKNEVREDVDPGDEIIARALAKKKSFDAGTSKLEPPQSNTGAVKQERGRTKPRPLSPSKKPIRQPSDVIALSSEDESAAPPPKRRSPTPPIPDSDDDNPELAARVRARRKQLEAESRASRNGATEGIAGNGVVPSIERRSTDTPEIDFDPVIQVLITSPLEGTKALLVHRRLSQRFAEIRNAWCTRQGFDEDTAQSVFFTYKMRKIYDVTTCKSLGIEVDTDGRVLPDVGKQDVFTQQVDGFEDGEQKKDNGAGKLHVVAVTDAAWAELKRVRAEEKAGKSKAKTPVEESEDNEKEEAPQKDEGKRVRLLIKSKGLADYKLIVRPSTTFDRIIGAFKKEKKLTADAVVTLKFDGEALSPDEEVQGADIEDMDSLEAHVK